MTTSDTLDRTEALERKVDNLLAEVRALRDEAERQRLSRERWSELYHDSMPVASEAMSRAASRLDQVAMDPDRIVDLLTRLAADVEVLEGLLVALESGAELVGDVSQMSSEMMQRATAAMAELDARGYFRFARAGLGVVDEVVGNFTEDDVRQLGENVVLILQVVKEMTQPEILAVVKRMIEAVERQRAAIEAEPIEPPSLWALLRQTRDPEVRRGIARALNTLRAVTEVDVAAAGDESREQPTPQGGM